jgi:hypothetical protein
MAEKRGRRPLLTPETGPLIVAAVAAGEPLKFAAESNGIDEDTLMSWLRKGRREQDPLYVEFLKEIKKAQSAAVSVRVKRITRSGRQTWQANAWWLERMHPDHFGTDKKLVAQLLDQVTTLKSQLDNLNADTRGNRGRRKKGRKKGKPRTIKGDGDGV